MIISYLIINIIIPCIYAYYEYECRNKKYPDGKINFTALANSDLNSTIYGFKCSNVEIKTITASGIEILCINITLIDNNIDTFPRNFTKRYSDLEEIRITRNKLSKITNEDFNNNTKLIKIFIYRNKITEITSNAFKYNEELTDIDFSNNLLHELKSDIFKKNINLRRISAYNNKLASIEGSWLHLTRLEMLSVKNNKLTELYENIFKLKQIKYLYLHNNPFLCGNDLKWTLDFRSGIIEYDKDSFIGECVGISKGDDLNIYDFLIRSRPNYNKAMKHISNLEVTEIALISVLAVIFAILVIINAFFFMRSYKKKEILTKNQGKNKDDVKNNQENLPINKQENIPNYGQGQNQNNERGGNPNNGRGVNPNKGRGQNPNKPGVNPNKGRGQNPNKPGQNPNKPGYMKSRGITKKMTIKNTKSSMKE